MKKKSNNKKKLILIIVLFLIIGYVVYLTDLNHYKSVFENLLSKSLNTEVKISSIRLNLIKGCSISFRGVELSDKNTKNVYFDAKDIRCKFRVTDLFRNIRFDSVFITRPVLRLEKSPDGKIHLPQLSKNKKEPDNETVHHDDKKLILPRIKWFNFDESTFYPDEIVVFSGSVELSDTKEKSVLKNVYMRFNKNLDTPRVDFDIEVKLDQRDSNSVRLNGSIETDNIFSQKNSFSFNMLSSPLDMNISVDNVKLSSIYELLMISKKPLPEDIPIWISGKLNGTLKDDLSLSVRLFTDSIKKYKNLTLDTNLVLNLNKKQIKIKDIITSLNNKSFVADGFYDWSSAKGEIYIQSELMRIEHLRDIFPFLKNFQSEGVASISAFAEFTSLSRLPVLSGSVYLEEFTGQFKNLAEPVKLREPCVGEFSRKKVVFDDAPILFGDNPLTLDLTYTFIPEPKLYLGIKDFEEVQLLDIFTATMLDKQVVKKDDDNQKRPEQAKLKPTKRSVRKSKKRLPIYISGMVKNAYLYCARFDTFYVDCFVENDRMLFRDININLYEGKFRGNGVVVMSPDYPSYSFVADIDNVNLNNFLKTSTNFKDVFFGYLSSAMSFQCMGKDAKTVSETLKSQGMLKIKDGKISNFGLLKKILQRFSDAGEDNKTKLFGKSVGLKMPPIEEFGLDNDTVFQSLRCDFSIRKDDDGVNSFYVNPLRIDSISMDMNLSGKFDFDQNLDFKGDIKLSKIQTEKILHKVNEIALFFKMNDGCMEIPLKIKGTFSSPRPKPIMKIENVGSVINGIFKDKLIKKRSEDIDPLIGIEDKMGIDEGDKKKIRRLRKKIEKYLE